MDVLLSILHFAQYEPATAQWLQGEGGNEKILQNANPASPEFIEYALSMRAAALLSVSAEWLDVASVSVRYENLVANPRSTLEDILRSLSMTARIPIDKAVEDNTISRLRLHSQHHFWRGTPGLWHHVIPKNLRKAIAERHGSIFERLRYTCENDSAPSHDEARMRWTALCAE
jgi:hypothetical protein